MLDVIIFDIDGTLVDSVDAHAEAWATAFKEFGYDVAFEQMKQKIGKGGEFILEEVLDSEDLEKLGDKVLDFRNQYFQNTHLQKIRPFPKVKELFHRLRDDNIEIVLSTSAQPEVAQHYIDLLEVSDLIQGATNAADVDKAKPNSDVFEAALSKLKSISRDKTIVVGDSPYDAEAAVKASLQTIGLLSGGFSEEKLMEAGCIAIYKNPADLLEHYAESPLG